MPSARTVVPCLAVAVVTAFVAGLGCSSTAPASNSSPSTTTGACGFTGAIPKLALSANTTNELENGELQDGGTAQGYAEAQGLRFLDTFVGSFLRGDTTIYQGTLEASDNQSVLGQDCAGVRCKNESISEGSAVASLAVTSGVATLEVHSLADHKYIVLTESKSVANVTNVSIVLPDSSQGGNSGTCTKCATDFVSKPSAITFKDLVSTAQVAVNPGVTDGGTGAALSTHATGSLTLSAPCALTFNDLVELNSLNGLPTSNYGYQQNVMNTFTQQGGDMVATVQGSVYAYIGEQYCTTSYTIDLYVSLSNLADYGVRNFQTFKPDASYEQICP
jgi:hypothetical protein